MRRAAVAFLAASVGCTMALMDTVPAAWKPSEPLRCGGYVYPVVDTAVAASWVWFTTAGFPITPDIESAAAFRILEISVYAYFVVAATSGVAAIAGYESAHRCGCARRGRAAWLHAHPEPQPQAQPQP